MSFGTLKKKHLILLITKSYSQSFSSIYTIWTDCLFTVHTLKIEYNVSLFVVPTLLKELLKWYGVPKGSALGPVLFCIYINDLSLHIPSNSTECHMLAYDTTLHTTGKSLKSIMQIQKAQQLCLDHIWKWYNANHMLINPVKTKSMLINTRQKHQLSVLSPRLSWMVKIFKMQPNITH